MGILEFIASTSLIDPWASIISKGKVLVVDAAGRESANDMAAHLIDHGIEVYSYYMQPNNTIRFKVDDVKKARRLLK